MNVMELKEDLTEVRGMSRFRNIGMTVCFVNNKESTHLKFLLNSFDSAEMFSVFSFVERSSCTFIENLHKKAESIS